MVWLQGLKHVWLKVFLLKKKLQCNSICGYSEVNYTAFSWFSRESLFMEGLKIFCPPIGHNQIPILWIYHNHQGTSNLLTTDCGLLVSSPLGLILSKQSVFHHAWLWQIYLHDNPSCSLKSSKHKNCNLAQFALYFILFIKNPGNHEVIVLKYCFFYFKFSK